MTTDAAFEARIFEFEQTWQSQTPPSITDFLPADRPLRRRLLLELICLDLEFRWRNTGNVETKPLESYFREFPELGHWSTLPGSLIAEEYRVRHRWGNRPAHAEYQQRFGWRTDLPILLGDVDNELRSETLDHESRTELLRPRLSVTYGEIRLRRMIGAGGFGKVYVADRRGCEKPVAVKFLRKSFWRWQDAVERFLAEADILTRLQHDGIVAVHGTGMTPAGGPFFVMDLVEGPNLAESQAAGQVSFRIAIRWIAEACRVIAHAHAHGIIHCDLKPANLLLGADGRVRVTDFGLARSAANSGLGIGGTVGFMAPEQLDPQLGPIGPATDVYGLGAVLFFLLTGKPPGSTAELPADLLAAKRIEMSVIDVCRKCLATRPEQRFPDTASMLRTLDKLTRKIPTRNPES